MALFSRFFKDIPLNWHLPGRRAGRLAAVAGSALVLAACGGDGAVAPAQACAQQVNDTEDKLLACVTLDGVLAHLREFDRIAKANGGHRAAGSAGYEASGAYAEKVLRDAGYVVTRSEFGFVRFDDLGGSVLRQMAPLPGADFAHEVMPYSGSGDVTASVTALAGPGCAAADFAGFPAGNIVLIERGGCDFSQKASLALAAGAAGVVVYNNAEGPVHGSLGEGFTADLPVLEVSQAVGRQLAGTPGLALRMAATTRRERGTTFNVLAESRAGDPDHVVMAGAHLDSVLDGPGIYDNGSGSAAILETAVQMARVTPRHKVRFALWGAEEIGILGATDYVERLEPDALAKIALYLNFDMIASPNAGYFIYDGDDSDGIGEGPGPEGAGAIEKFFEAFYAARGKAFKGTDFDGRSDYGPFIRQGIPAGGIFSGGEDIKTADDAARWGGTAGIAFDPCYHAACDGLANLDLAVLDLNSDAVAAATLRYANDLGGIRGASAARPLQSVRAAAYTPPSDIRPRHLPALK